MSIRKPMGTFLRTLLGQAAASGPIKIVPKAFINKLSKKSPETQFLRREIFQLFYFPAARFNYWQPFLAKWALILVIGINVKLVGRVDCMVQVS